MAKEHTDEWMSRVSLPVALMTPVLAVVAVTVMEFLPLRGLAQAATNISLIVSIVGAIAVLHILRNITYSKANKRRSMLDVLLLIVNVLLCTASVSMFVNLSTFKPPVLL